MPLLGHWDDDSIPSASYGPYSECWGYHANGREYAFLATSQATCFFDVTDPRNPTLIDCIRTKDTLTLVINKDYATHSHYLYAVSDQGQNALQIFDLQYLPDSVVMVYNSDVVSKRCHTVFVEGDRLYMCHNTRPDNSLGPMDIFSLANPENPVLLGTVSNPGFFTVHETYVRNDTAYCSNGYNGLWIYNVSNPSNPVLLNKIDIYPQNGYNHSAWPTDDGRTLVFTDENRGYGVKVFDISDFNDPVLRKVIRSNMLQVPDPASDVASIPHNPYIIGNKLLVSYYHDGVQAYDISNPDNPVHIGFHTTAPEQTSYTSYAGCWGLYPFLPSGNIIASDMNNGLFIIDGTRIFNYQPPPANPSLQISYSYSEQAINLQYQSALNELWQIEIYDMAGRLITKNEIQVDAGAGNNEIQLPGISSGLLLMNVSSASANANFKIPVWPTK
jgi:choice-of-anchor B domain-containing protein